MIISIDKENIANRDIMDDIDSILNEIDANECTHKNAYWRIGKLLGLENNTEESPRISEIEEGVFEIDIVI